jgi:hypothetical protein
MPGHVLQKEPLGLHQRCRIARAKHDIQFGKGKFRRLRRWQDPRTGEIMKTVEVRFDLYV